MTLLEPFLVLLFSVSFGSLFYFFLLLMKVSPVVLWVSVAMSALLSMLIFWYWRRSLRRPMVPNKGVDFIYLLWGAFNFGIGNLMHGFYAIFSGEPFPRGVLWIQGVIFGGLIFLTVSLMFLSFLHPKRRVPDR